MKAGKAKKGVDLAAGSNDTENKSHMSDPAHAGPRLASGGKKQPSAFSKPSAAKRTHKTHSSASASSDEDPGRAKLNKGRTVGAKLICTPKAPRRVLGPIGRKNMMMRQQGLQPQEASQPKTSVTLKRKRKLMRPAVEATLFPSSGSGNWVVGQLIIAVISVWCGMAVCSWSVRRSCIHVRTYQTVDLAGYEVPWLTSLGCDSRFAHDTIFAAAPQHVSKLGMLVN